MHTETRISSENLPNIVSSLAEVSELLKGKIGHIQTCEYVLAVFLWKYISDLWKEDFESLGILNDEASIRRRLINTRFYVPPETSFHDVVENSDDERVGIAINVALEKISFANRGRLDLLFQNLDFTSETFAETAEQRAKLWDSFLSKFTEPILDLRPSTTKELNLGEASSGIVSHLQQNFRQDSKTTYTPSYLSKLIAKLADAKEGDSICDPVCGTASLLIRTSEEIPGRNFSLFGQEIDKHIWSIARMNLLFHELDEARTENGDSLIRPAFVDGDELRRFDRVVANPPTRKVKGGLAATGTMGLVGKSKGNRWYDYSFGASGTLVFFDLAITIAKPRGGRVVIVVPEGFLFRGKDEWGFRQKLIRENILEAVISIPEGSAKNSPTYAVLVVDRAREHGGDNSGKTDVVFVDSKEIYHELVNSASFEQVFAEQVISAYRGASTADHFIRRVTNDEIEQNNFDFSVSRYVQPAQMELNQLIENEEKIVRRLEEELQEMRVKIEENLKKLERRRADSHAKERAPNLSK